MLESVLESSRNRKSKKRELENESESPDSGMNQKKKKKSRQMKGVGYVCGGEKTQRKEKKEETYG